MLRILINRAETELREEGVLTSDEGGHDITSDQEILSPSTAPKPVTEPDSAAPQDEGVPRR